MEEKIKLEITPEEALDILIEHSRRLRTDLENLGMLNKDSVEKVFKDAARYKWLCQQFWVEQEATFCLSLPDTDDSVVYQEALDEVIDKKLADNRM